MNKIIYKNYCKNCLGNYYVSDEKDIDENLNLVNSVVDCVKCRKSVKNSETNLIARYL